MSSACNMTYDTGCHVYKFIVIHIKSILANNNFIII